MQCDTFLALTSTPTRRLQDIKLRKNRHSIVKDSPSRPHSWSGVLQKLISRRTAPLLPAACPGTTTSSTVTPVLYTEILKPAVKQQQKEETSPGGEVTPYSLAEEIDNWFDNPAG